MVLFLLREFDILNLSIEIHVIVMVLTYNLSGSYIDVFAVRRCFFRVVLVHDDFGVNRAGVVLWHVYSNDLREIWLKAESMISQEEIESTKAYHYSIESNYLARIYPEFE